MALNAKVRFMAIDGPDKDFDEFVFKSDEKCDLESPL